MDIEVAWWGPTDTLALPIVLLHEGLGSVSLWRDFPDLLAARTGRRVMAYSRSGHGNSAPAQQPHTTEFMHDEARLLPVLMNHAQIERAILLGHSDGGSIALICAADHPQRIEGLILEAPHVFVEDVSVESIQRTTESYRMTTLRERLAHHHRNVDVAFSGWSDVWLDPEFRKWNLEAFLPHITCPTLLIQGEQDEYGTLRQIDAIERQIGGPVNRLVLSDCGHSPHRDQREQVLDVVAAFVSRLA